MPLNFMSRKALQCAAFERKAFSLKMNDQRTKCLRAQLKRAGSIASPVISFSQRSDHGSHRSFVIYIEKTPVAGALRRSPANLQRAGSAARLVRSVFRKPQRAAD